MVNIALNLILLPSMGIVGAGIALVASYAVILVLMYIFTQRLFKVPYEWLRLAQAAGLAIVLVLVGELLLPTSGFWGLAGRTALWLAYPLLLWVTGFLNDEEREAAGRVLSPAYVKAALSRLREAPPPRRRSRRRNRRRCGATARASRARRSRPSSGTRTRSASAAACSSTAAHPCRHRLHVMGLRGFPRSRVR